MRTIKLIATIIAVLSIASVAYAANPGFTVSATHTGNDWTYVFANAAGSGASVFAWTLYWADNATPGGPGYLPADQTAADANFYDGFTVVGGNVVIDSSNPNYGYPFALPNSWFVDYSYINHPSFTSTDNSGNPISPIAAGGSQTFKVHYYGSTAPGLFMALYGPSSAPLQAFGTVSGVPGTVPEPGSILALLSGLGSLAAFKLRKKS